MAQTTPARAQHIKAFFHSVCQDFKRNNCWPKPFTAPDRQAVRAPIELMVQSGWQRQNLIGEFHFDRETGELTEAGHYKIRWIVTQVPRAHRAIFVSRAATPHETAARIQAVQDVAIEAVGRDNLPSVAATTRDPGGWPAGRVDAIGRKLQDSMPTPILPAASPSGSSGGS